LTEHHIIVQRHLCRHRRAHLFLAARQTRLLLGPRPSLISSDFVGAGLAPPALRICYCSGEFISPSCPWFCQPGLFSPPYSFLHRSAGSGGMIPAPPGPG
jgi:hypothetical protein